MCHPRDVILTDLGELVSLSGWSEKYVAKLISGNVSFVDRLREGKVTIALADRASLKLKELLAERQANGKDDGSGT